MKFHRSALAVVLAAAGLAPTAAPALADIDSPAGNGDKITASVGLGAPTAMFRVTCPAGATLGVSAAGKKAKGAKQAPAIRFHVLDSTGQEIAAPSVKTTATGEKLSGFKVPATGEYRVVVNSDNGVGGDFSLLIAWKSATKVALDGVVGAADATLHFAADAGAIPTFDVSAPKGSLAQPYAKAIAGGAFTASFTKPAAGTTRSKVTGAALPVTHDYDLTIADQGAIGGGFHVAVTLKLPKAAKRKITLTASQITPTANGQSATLAAILDAAGGTVAADGTGATPIDGAAVSIPAGALGAATGIVVGTASTLAVPKGASGGGPSVFFGPEGLKFTKDVTITIPFDPALFPAGDLSGLKVFTRDAAGHVTQVTATLTVNRIAGTVSFASSHFSAYRAAGPQRKPPADLDADGTDDLVVPAPGDGNGRGAVFVFRGGAGITSHNTSAADLTFTGTTAANGPVPGDTFGAAVATGDVNGDGIADLVVGASRENGGVGKVYVFFGGTGFHSGTAAQADAVLTGNIDDLRFGAVVVVADANGDGKPDVIVGAPYSSIGQLEAGAAYVFPGGTGFASRSASSPGVITLQGADAFDHFGVSIAVGDVTNDGKPDIAVGADQLLSQGTGAVYVFSNGSALSSPAIAGTGTLNFTGAAARDRFGISVAIGDLNQDGIADLAVGAPDADIGGKTDSGTIYAFFGKTGLAGASASIASRSIPIANAAANDEAGTSIQIANIISGSTPDIVFSVPGGDRFSRLDSGDVYLGRGGADFYPAPQIITGEQEFDSMGKLLPPADVNGDGRLDVLIAVPDRTDGTSHIRVVFGPGLIGKFIDITGTAAQRLGDTDLDPDIP